MTQREILNLIKQRVKETEPEIFDDRYDKCVHYDCRGNFVDVFLMVIEDDDVSFEKWTFDDSLNKLTCVTIYGEQDYTLLDD